MTVAELLTSSDKWTCGASARDADGNNVDVFDDKAESFCLSGALMRCYSDEDIHERMRNKVASYITENYPRRIRGIFSFNDDLTTTFADVRAVIEATGI